MGILTLVKSAGRATTKFVIAHAPAVATGVALIGLTSTVISVVKATKKSSEIIKKAEAEKGTELTKTEKVKATWKTWLPAIIAIIVTAGSTVATPILAHKQLSAVTMGASALLAEKDNIIAQTEEKALQAAKEKAVEKKVEEGLARDETGKVMQPIDADAIILDNTPDAKYWRLVLFGLTVKATRARVDDAKRAVYREYTSEGRATTETFVRALGLPWDRVPSCAKWLGWEENQFTHMEGYVPEIETKAIEIQGGETMLAIDMAPDLIPF